DYANLIASYLVANFENRGIRVYREIYLGKTVIGKDRRVDLFVHHPESERAFAIECKYQDSKGTADEKIFYALDDMTALRNHMPGCVVYAGEGMSRGILHLLEASPFAAYCLPSPELSRGKQTEELDHLLAMAFGWWDIVIASSLPYSLPSLFTTTV
ncbi:MAG TPA: PD-(D/E)XK nuclease superfamily protein, partial [Chroococcales cyanobacterium]